MGAAALNCLAYCVGVLFRPDFLPMEGRVYKVFANRYGSQPSRYPAGMAVASDAAASVLTPPERRTM